jgi:hypothetical protein
MLGAVVALVVMATVQVHAVEWATLPCPRDNFSADGCSWSPTGPADVVVSLFFQVRP